MTGFEEVEAERFADAFSLMVANPLFGPFLTCYDVDDFRRMRCFLAEGGRVGGAIRPTPAGGELVSLFNNGGPPGSGRRMIEKLVEEGATCLSCIGDHLRTVYERFGFGVVETLEWEERYAPDGWDYEKWDRPSIYVMER